MALFSIVIAISFWLHTPKNSFITIFLFFTFRSFSFFSFHFFFFNVSVSQLYYLSFLFFSIPFFSFLFYVSVSQLELSFQSFAVEMQWKDI